jgi:hypothetical protein
LLFWTETGMVPAKPERSEEMKDSWMPYAIGLVPLVLPLLITLGPSRVRLQGSTVAIAFLKERRGGQKWVDRACNSLRRSIVRRFRWWGVKEVVSLSQKAALLVDSYFDNFLDSDHPDIFDQLDQRGLIGSEIRFLVVVTSDSKRMHVMGLDRSRRTGYAKYRLKDGYYDELMGDPLEEIPFDLTRSD